MKFIKENKNKIIIVGIIIVLIVIFGLLLNFFVFNDEITSIKYQMFENNKASEFKEDGKEIKVDTPITGINAIISSKYSGLLYINISNATEDIACYSEVCKLENPIEKISFELTDTLNNKYDIYYRIYNGEWSKWAHNSEKVGEEEKYITKLQLRLVPKGAYLGDYLDGYEVINND